MLAILSADFCLYLQLTPQVLLGNYWEQLGWHYQLKLQIQKEQCILQIHIFTSIISHCVLWCLGRSDDACYCLMPIMSYISCLWVVKTIKKNYFIFKQKNLVMAQTQTMQEKNICAPELLVSHSKEVWLPLNSFQIAARGVTKMKLSSACRESLHQESTQERVCAGNAAGEGSFHWRSDDFMISKPILTRYLQKRVHSVGKVEECLWRSVKT